jgi:protein-tyrosine phosphatase
MRPLAAHCHAGLGRTASAAGRRGEAQPHLLRAHEMYAEMRMAFSPETAGLRVQVPG